VPDPENAGETLLPDLVPVPGHAPGGHVNGPPGRGPGHGQIQEQGGGEVRTGGVHLPKGENRPIPEKEKIPDPDLEIEILGEDLKKEGDHRCRREDTLIQEKEIKKERDPVQEREDTDESRCCVYKRNEKMK